MPTDNNHTMVLLEMNPTVDNLIQLVLFWEVKPLMFSPLSHFKNNFFFLEAIILQLYLGFTLKHLIPFRGISSGYDYSLLIWSMRQAWILISLFAQRLFKYCLFLIGDKKQIPLSTGQLLFSSLISSIILSETTNSSHHTILTICFWTSFKLCTLMNSHQHLERWWPLWPG